MSAADPVPLLLECRDLLHRVDEGVRWAYSAGWYPGHRWVGEPPGQDMFLAPPSPKHPETEEERQRRLDSVPGAKHDIGMGDYNARESVARVGPGLTKASAFLEDACEVVGAASGANEIPSSVILEPVIPLAAINKAVPQMNAQLGFLLDNRPNLTDQAKKYVAGRIVQARSNLATLVAGLDRWASNVPESRKLPVTLCKTCTIRPCPVRKGKVVSRECDTCHSWRYRHGGKTRPPSLDDREKAAPSEAQSRRLAAGEGWGWS